MTPAQEVAGRAKRWDDGAMVGGGYEGERVDEVELHRPHCRRSDPPCAESPATRWPARFPLSLFLVPHIPICPFLLLSVIPMAARPPTPALLAPAVVAVELAMDRSAPSLASSVCKHNSTAELVGRIHDATTGGSELPQTGGPGGEQWRRGRSSLTGSACGFGAGGLLHETLIRRKKTVHAVEVHKNMEMELQG